ncbi:MAG TPA: hypothetical protein PKC43_01085 [Phycisphaerales bacterium]|nr:hypothetical protein [Phycisphaerales bacterium]HMP36020.1 hypothetical protein [Phycisphaerales bacterium]
MAHDHSDLPAIDHDDPEPGSTWFVGLAGAIVLTALVLAISVLYFSAVEEKLERVVGEVPALELERLRVSQQQLVAEFGRYTFVDGAGAESTRLRMPVSDAMRLIVERGALPAGPSAPSPIPSPAPSAPPASATTN